MKKEYYYVSFAVLFALLGYLFTNHWVCALLIFLFVLFDCFFIIRKNEIEKDIKRKEEAYLSEFRYRYALLTERDKTNPQLLKEVAESFEGDYEEIDKEDLNQKWMQKEIEWKKEGKKSNVHFYAKHHVDALKEHLNEMEKKQKREKDKKTMILSYACSICFMLGLRILLHPYYQQMIGSSIFLLFIFFFVVLIWISIHMIFFRKEDVIHEKMESHDREEE